MAFEKLSILDGKSVAQLPAHHQTLGIILCDLEYVWGFFSHLYIFFLSLILLISGDGTQLTFAVQAVHWA